VGDCVNHRDGVFRVYNHVADDYATPALTEEQVLDVFGVTPDRVERAKLNGCSFRPEDLRCVPGKILVRRGPNGGLIPEDPAEWILAPPATLKAPPERPTA
jgi:hypothetical protein